MSVYIDRPIIEFCGTASCHLVADTELELDRMAYLLNIKKSWKRHNKGVPYYTITMGRRYKAIRYGAQSVSQDFVVQFIRDHKKGVMV